MKWLKSSSFPALNNSPAKHRHALHSPLVLNEAPYCCLDRRFGVSRLCHKSTGKHTGEWTVAVTVLSPSEPITSPSQCLTKWEVLATDYYSHRDHNLLWYELMHENLQLPLTVDCCHVVNHFPHLRQLSSTGSHITRHDWNFLTTSSQLFNVAFNIYQSSVHTCKFITQHVLDDSQSLRRPGSWTKQNGTTSANILKFGYLLTYIIVSRYLLIS